MKWSEMSERERDALVAEKVMGWDVVTGSVGYRPKVIDYVTAEPEETPKYTSSIADAWQVVEKFWKYQIERLGSWRFYATVNPDPNTKFGSIAETAPEAICIAALKAVGCEVEE